MAWNKKRMAEIVGQEEMFDVHGGQSLPT